MIIAPENTPIYIIMTGNEVTVLTPSECDEKEAIIYNNLIIIGTLTLVNCL